MSVQHKTFEFDATMDWSARQLKMFDKKNEHPEIEGCHFDKTGGFVVVRFKSGKHHSLKCLEDLWEIVKDPKVKEFLMKNDKSGILKNDGLKFYH